MKSAVPTVIPFEDISPEDVASLWNDCYPDSELAAESARSVLGEHLERKASFAAVDGMDIVACVLSQHLPEIESDPYWFVESAGVILAVLVRPSHRRQGVGSHLVKLAESRHAERGRTKVVLGAVKGLPSLSPGVGAEDITARLFLTTLGYKHVRTSIEMRALCSKKGSKELVKMEAAVLMKGIAIVSSEAADEEEYVRFLKNSARAGDPLAIERWKSAPEKTILARKGLSVIGAASVEASAGGERREGEFALCDVCVASPEKGKGVGSALVARALRLCGMEGAKKLTVLAPAGNGAFFRRLGFVRNGEWLSFIKSLRREAGERWAERYREAR